MMTQQELTHQESLRHVASILRSSIAAAFFLPSFLHLSSLLQPPFPLPPLHSFKLPQHHSFLHSPLSFSFPCKVECSLRPLCFSFQFISFSLSGIYLHFFLFFFQKGGKRVESCSLYIFVTFYGLFIFFHSLTVSHEGISVCDPSFFFLSLPSFPLQNFFCSLESFSYNDDLYQALVIRCISNICFRAFLFSTLVTGYALFCHHFKIYCKTV